MTSQTPEPYRGGSSAGYPTSRYPVPSEEGKPIAETNVAFLRPDPGNRTHRRRDNSSPDGPIVPRIQLEPSPNALIPTRGSAKRQYERNRKRNTADPENPRYLLVPPLGRDEQAEHDARVARQEAEATALRLKQEADERTNVFWYTMAWYITRLQALVNVNGLRINIATSNIKGTSGKSARAFGIGSAISYFGGKSMLLLTSTLSTSVADSGSMSGLPIEDWARLSDVAEIYEQINSPEEFSDNIPATKARLFVIAEDEYANVPGRKKLTPERFFAMADKFNKLLYGGIIFDMGQDSISENNFVFDVIKRAHVIVFSALAGSKISKNKMTVSIDGLRTAPPNFGYEGVGRYVSIPDKVANSIVVLNGVDPGTTIDFDEFTVPTDQSKGAPATAAFNGVTMTVPIEETLVASGDKDVVYNPFKVSKLTLLADLEEAVACYQQGAKLLNIDISHLDELEPDFDYASTLLGVDIRVIAERETSSIKAHLVARLKDSRRRC